MAEMLLARYQPCGCIICSCENEENKCHGCGASHCGNHPLGELPNPVFDSKAPTLEEHDARIQAEVLAACIKAVHERWKKNNGFNEAGPVLADLEDDIRTLQPAAADLEEHDKELLFERDVEWTLAVLGDTDTCHEPKSAAELLDTDSNTLHGIIESLHKKIAELEKARAILGELKR